MATQVQPPPVLQVLSGAPRMSSFQYVAGQRMGAPFTPGAQSSQPGGQNVPFSPYQRTQFPSAGFYRPFKPMAVGVEMDYEGKKLRKSMMRKTVDYNASIICHLNNRVWQRDYRDRRVLQPDVTYYPQMAPPSGYLDNAVNAVTTRYTKVATNKMRCPIFCLSWTPEGRRLITGASSGEFTLWNGLTYNFETILQAHDAPVRTMVWSHDESWMVTGDHNGFVKYWQSNMNNVKMFQAHKEPLRGLSFSPSDHKFATCSDDGTVRVWDFIRCHEERILRGHGADVKCVDWHPHKGIIVSGSKDNQQPIKIWDPRTGSSLTTLHSHKSTVMDIRWNQNGNWLLTASRDHLVKVFDIRNLGTELQIFRGHKKEAVCLSWNPIHESLFASGGSDGAILFWHVGIDKEVGAIENAHDNMIWSMSWHPMGHVLASGANDHTTKFWTRNRPGDKMKDKYNLNTLPPSVAPEDAEWEDKTTHLVAGQVSQEHKEEKASTLSSAVPDALIPGLDVTVKLTEVSRSKVTLSGSATRKGPVEYVEFQEDKIPKQPVPIGTDTRAAFKLLESSIKAMYNFREEKPSTEVFATTFAKLGIPQLIEKVEDESEPIDVKLLPFVTHIIAAGQVLKSEGKSEVFGAARQSVERFYDSLSRRGYFYEKRLFAGERSVSEPLTEEELASYDGVGPLPERRIRSPTPPPEPEPVRKRPERRRDKDKNDSFEGKRGRFDGKEDRSFWGNEEDFKDEEDEYGPDGHDSRSFSNGPSRGQAPGGRGPPSLMSMPLPPGPPPLMGQRMPGPPHGPPMPGAPHGPQMSGPPHGPPMSGPHGPPMPGPPHGHPMPGRHHGPPMRGGLLPPPNEFGQTNIQGPPFPMGPVGNEGDFVQQPFDGEQYQDMRGPPGPRPMSGRQGGPMPPHGRGGIHPRPADDDGRYNLHPPSDGPNMPRNGPDHFRGGPPGRGMIPERGGFAGMGSDDRGPRRGSRFDDDEVFDEFPPEFDREGFAPMDGRHGDFFPMEPPREMGRGRGERQHFDEDNRRGPPSRGRGFGNNQGEFMGRPGRPMEEEGMVHGRPPSRGFGPERGGFRGRGRGNPRDMDHDGGFDGRGREDDVGFADRPGGRGFGPERGGFRGRGRGDFRDGGDHGRENDGELGEFMGRPGRPIDEEGIVHDRPPSRGFGPERGGFRGRGRGNPRDMDHDGGFDGRGREDDGGFADRPAGRGFGLERGGFRGRGRGDFRDGGDHEDFSGPRGGFRGHGRDEPPRSRDRRNSLDKSFEEDHAERGPPGSRGRGRPPHGGARREEEREDRGGKAFEEEHAERGPPGSRGRGRPPHGGSRREEEREDRDGKGFEENHAERGPPGSRGRGRPPHGGSRRDEDREDRDGKSFEEDHAERGPPGSRGRGRPPHGGPRREEERENRDGKGFEEDHAERGPPGSRGRGRPPHGGSRREEEREDRDGRFSRDRSSRFDDGFPDNRDRSARDDRDNGPRSGRGGRSRGRDRGGR